MPTPGAPLLHGPGGGFSGALRGLLGSFVVGAEEAARERAELRLDNRQVPERS